MPVFRPEIEALTQSPISQVALPRLHDKDIIPLWFGEGDLVTDEFIRERAKAALDHGQTFYVNPRGRMDLRLAIRDYLSRLCAVDLDVERITVPGAAMLGITLAGQTALTTGSHAVIVGPAWMNVYNTLRATGADITWVRKHCRAGHWSLDLAELFAAVGVNTRAIFVNTPCNPTGWVMPAQQQRELLEFCRARGILLIADEVYQRLVYEGEAAPSFVSIAGDDDPVIVVNGFSKSWAMTGWRLGWMVAPRRLATTLGLLSECFNTGATVFAQAGGVAALEQSDSVVQTLRAQYARGRALVQDALGRHPRIELALPQGAFYAFPRLPGVRIDREFVERMADEAKVGVSPGFGFGPGNDDHFRLCFAQSPERLRIGLDRILGFLDDTLVS